jgi:riboflavin kinase/FMN adenylyltransferase
MKAQEELAAIRPSKPTVAAIGVFDGVHLGHQHLIAQVKQAAARANTLSAVVTFLNHPISVLRPNVQLAYLSTPERRLALLREQGVDIVAPVTFDRELSQLTARDFLLMLRDHLRLAGLVAGPDFAMGRNREGTFPVLRALGLDLGIAVHEASALEQSGIVVSSTAARQALFAGDTMMVARMLGRPFRLDGMVGHGDHRGTVMGFPTANLVAGPTLALPKDGIYATWTCLGDKRYQSATSIGVRPTFGDGLHRTIETFILDFKGDIYEQPMGLEFAARLRDEEKFPSMQALMAQMERDVVSARASLKECAWMLTNAPVR